MKDETYYRMLQSEDFPCQHCGAKLNLYMALAQAFVIHNGRIRAECQTCGGHIPQFEYRDYGVDKHRGSDRLTTQGFAYTDSRHWTESGRNQPLWAIPSNLG